MPDFPKIPEARRLERLQPPKGKVRMVLDTDTYNEIDDQFAVVYALLSPEQMDVEAVYAAPFHNNRSSGPGDGMERSYEEILRVLERLDVSPEGLVHRGSTTFLPDGETPCESDMTRDLIERAMATDDEPLYVAAIGAITNVASAILIEPAIIERIVLVWLGGQPLHWRTAREFNLKQDVPASRVIFDCGVPLIHIPCTGVASHLQTTVAEMERYVQGRGAIGDYLTEIFKDYHADHFAWSKVIWDIATIAYLINPAWVPTLLVHSPILTDQVTWSVDQSRHLIRHATYVDRDPIFKDLFTKLNEGQKA
ncbi:MAG: nucleoside hydrolase [Planctomycetes bacterium]|nr:nucleoside hydrolase [Planctomycetota bacterium]